jgi:hypothetical protein
MKYTFKYQHTAHYRTSHVVNRNEKEILIALHGYGQLSEYFLRKLHPIFREERLIVVPEATNYAYLEGFSGRVGANWMTRHERESAIDNNHHYLNGLLENILLKYKKTYHQSSRFFPRGCYGNKVGQSIAFSCRVADTLEWGICA